ncbi:DNA alkylation repair protein [Phocaeicola coprocola]|uniref:DNA alkylation repair protein n=1 Tax=Phocaeicola coprocola TaxID=310298 RepID=UPI001C38592B|nr:DNA alkylation repair protein [Phocaeicola coprocola]MBV3866436.1 DNA alkylation repair protein [Phocaeicola coprocola]MBV4007630.1 DNA alkylation repair protein [Phocaeicola coprocola]MBV4032089.1 DNA alkylation repair protein [Phocaeicola coprocola]MBV4038668.1 DNA alkylation repair protein [Phocaeicola coprocola]MBV4060304.1 DNA alkylation repair protein [Phocaeicola coprocola]
MDNNIHETIKDIKSKFRLFMNGMVSQSMREKGMEYKLNFGIEYPRIKEIAAGYEPDHELAQALWKENIRECKILAGLLQPADTFYPEIAGIWIEGMDYPELAEYTVMNLFQRLPYASEVVFRWMADEREMFQLCGFLLMARLLMKGEKLNERAEAEFLDQACTAVEGDCGPVQKAASVALRKYAHQSRENKRTVSKQLGIWAKSEKPAVRALAEEIKADLEF